MQHPSKIDACSFGRLLLAVSPCAAILFSAVCLAVSRLQGCNNGDSIVPVLVSVQHWTPFYWGTNRFGMLLPLLAMSFQNPFTNLMVQNLVSFALGMAAPFFMAKVLFREPHWPAIGALSAIFFVGLHPPCLLHTYLGTGQVYGPALALGYAGLTLLAAESHGGARRWTPSAGGVVLILLAFWLSPSLVLTALPVVVIPALLAADSSKSWWGLSRLAISWKTARWPFGLREIPWAQRAVLVVLLAFLGSLLASQWTPFHTRYPLSSPAIWPEGWGNLLRNFLLDFFPQGIARSLALLLALVGLGVVLLRCTFRVKRTMLVGCLAIAGAALCEVLVVGSNEWVRMNGYSSRYLFPSFWLLLMMPFGVLVTGLLHESASRWVHVFNGMALAGLVLVTLLRFGPPSPLEMRAAVDEACGNYSSEVVENGCTHFAGSYWKVWTTVFHANLLLHERNSGRVVWGLSDRAVATRHLWADKDPSTFRIAGARDDPDVESWLYRFGIWVEKERSLETIDVYRRLPSPPAVFRFRSSDFYSKLNALSKDSDTIASCSKATCGDGLMLHGPYMFLPKGRYSFRLSGTAEDVDASADILASVDFWDERNRNIGCRRQIKAGDLVNGRFLLSGEFEVIRESFDWEVEVHYWPVLNLTIREIILTRVD